LPPSESTNLLPEGMEIPHVCGRPEHGHFEALGGARTDLQKHIPADDAA
jgi:hypothetical protein